MMTRRKLPKRVALYLRVSNREQTIENQRRELTEVADRHGWRIVAEFADEGVSGAKGRDKRPGFDRLMKATTRREIDLVAAWSVDRLGRSLQDLVGFLGEVHGSGVDLNLHQQGIDTSTPAGKALFQMMGVFAEFERAMIQERIHAGLARARAEGSAWIEPKPPWQARKEAYLAALPNKPQASLLVSLADKTHNAEAILFDYRVLGNELWDRFNGGAAGTRWYYGALDKVFSSVMPGRLSYRLSRAVAAFAA
jgi:DNA invertase Pin-like site-specific DNA recombinase